MPPRTLTPGGAGERWFTQLFGPERAQEILKKINTWTPPEPHDGRCNQNCLDLLIDTIGPDFALEYQAAINTDAERFHRAKNDRSEAQSLAFGNRPRPITPEKLETQRQKTAERQRRWRERQKAAKETLSAS